MVGPSSRSTVHFLLFALLHVATTCWAACQLTPYYTAYYPNDLNVVITKNYVSTDTEREGSGRPLVSALGKGLNHLTTGFLSFFF